MNAAPAHSDAAEAQSSLPGAALVELSAAQVVEELPEIEAPLASFAGNAERSENRGSWALVNLICLVIALLAAISAAAGKRGSALAIALQIVCAAAALLAFAATESFSGAMKLVDGATVLMMTLAAGACVARIRPHKDA